MKTYHVLAALLGASVLATPALAVKTYAVTASFASGASFAGTVDFADDFSKALDVTGTLFGYGEGSNAYGTGNSFVNWVWANGANFAPAPNYGTFLMTGVEPGYASFFTFTVDLTSKPHLAFSSAGYGNNVNYVDPMVSGTISGAPEAATWAMMVTGFGLVGAATRRRKAALAA